MWTKKITAEGRQTKVQRTGRQGAKGTKQNCNGRWVQPDVAWVPVSIASRHLGYHDSILRVSKSIGTLYSRHPGHHAYSTTILMLYSKDSAGGTQGLRGTWANADGPGVLETVSRAERYVWLDI